MFFHFLFGIKLILSVQKVAKGCKNDPLKIFAQSVKVLRLHNGTFFFVKESYGNKYGVGHFLCFGVMQKS